MTRGSAADRLAAKILKNCGEVWGIGRYIDNQEFTIRYLWEHRQELDNKMQSELQRLVQYYKMSTGAASSKPKSQPKTEPSPFSKPQTGITQQVQQQPTADLYPANNGVVKRVRTITRHNPDWIYAQCSHYGYDRPAMMPPEDLEKLICDMCADFAFSIGAAVNRMGALTSIQSSLNFAKQSGQPIVDAALLWLERHQSVSSPR